MKKVLTAFIASSVVTVAAMAGATANAAVFACSVDTDPEDVTNNVTPSSACQASDSVSNDSPIGPFLAESWFGFDDWIFDGKDNDLDGVDTGVNNLGLELDGDRYSGDWELTGLSSLEGLQVMIVLKGGNSSDPYPIVAWLVTDIMGTYLSPFFNAQDVRQAISHISVYYRAIPSEVPVPGAIWLMAAGLAGLGFSSRKKKRT